VLQLMKDALLIYDITPIQYGVLKCLWELHMTNPNEISEKLGIDKSTMSGILERMENKDLLERSIDANDRRYICIGLTKKSRLLEKPVTDAVQKVNDVVLADFSADDANTLRIYLRKIM